MNESNARELKSRRNERYITNFLSIGRIKGLLRLNFLLILLTEREKLAKYPPAGLKNCSLS